MADQPKAMTLREAVANIMECRAHGLCGANACARARAIVDAAVEAHEARSACGEVQNAEPFDGEAFRVSWERLCELHDKLEALERGEDA